MRKPHGKEVKMLLRTHDAGIELRKGQVISVYEAKGLEIRVTRGTLWITHEDDDRDCVLKAGDHHFIASTGQTVVSALNNDAALIATRRQRPGTRHWLAVLLRWVRPALSSVRMRRHPVATLHAA